MSGKEMATLAYFWLVGFCAMWSHYLSLLAEDGYTTGFVLAVVCPVVCFGAMAVSLPPEDGP
jgi:hypothetical protein